MTDVRGGNVGGGQLPMSKMSIAGMVAGILSMIPCACTAFPIGIVGLGLSVLGLGRTLGASPRERGKAVAVAGLVLSVAGLLISGGLAVFMSDRADDTPKAPETVAFESANSFIATHSGSSGSGNTPQASALATTYSNVLETRVRESFTGFKDSAMSLSDNKQLVYCHLTDDTVVFLVHVPELRRYETDELRGYLREIAWQAACEVTEGEELNLVIGLRGALLYGSKMEGQNTGEMPAAQDRPSRADFERYFKVPKPTRTLYFVGQGDTPPPKEPAEPEESVAPAE